MSPSMECLGAAMLAVYPICALSAACYRFSCLSSVIFLWCHIFEGRFKRRSFAHFGQELPRFWKVCEGAGRQLDVDVERRAKGTASAGQEEGDERRSRREVRERELSGETLSRGWRGVTFSG